MNALTALLTVCALVALIFAIVCAPTWVAKFVRRKLMKVISNPARLRKLHLALREREAAKVAKQMQKQIIEVGEKLGTHGSAFTEVEYVGNWFKRAGYTVDEIATGYGNKWKISLQVTDKELSDIMLK